ncbi:MAG: alanine racemase [Woeseia sp.]
MTRGARARILPDALRHNLAVVRQRAPNCRIMAAIKGNAYGHGLLTAAHSFSDADSLAVARLTEAASLREAGVDKPLVLLPGVMNAAELQQSAELNCEIVVHSHAQLPLLEACAANAFIVWLKIDTGMHRLGFDAGEVAGIISRLQQIKAVREIRLMTHLASADEPQNIATRQQAEQFRSLARGFAGAISIANSAAIFSDEFPGRDPAFWGHDGDTWLRPGIALYGISPFVGQCGADLGLQAAMEFESRLLAVKPLRAGARVGYGGHWQTARDTTLGIIAAGYGDGYSRFLPTGTPVLVNGRRVALVGTVSMDLAAVDLGPAATDRVGDPVVLWGAQLPVEEVAGHAGTIAYQLVTGVMHREEPTVVSEA